MTGSSWMPGGPGNVSRSGAWEVSLGPEVGGQSGRPAEGMIIAGCRGGDSRADFRRWSCKPDETPSRRPLPAETAT